MMDFATLIRTVPDWPEPGVQFRDITPLLRDAVAFRELIETFARRYEGTHVDAVVGIDARGFIIGAALAYRLGCGFIPVRKKGKLPYDTLAAAYTLEYGQATVEIHVDAANPGEHVLVVDDLVATGGTLLATVDLMRQLGAHIVEAAAVIDLPGLGGSPRLKAAGVEFYSVLRY